MADIRWQRRIRKELEDPVLLLAFQGWSDAAESASMALDYLRKKLGARLIATISADEFFDFTVVRPQVTLDSKGARRLVWPDVRLYVAETPPGQCDFLLLKGFEPQLKWRRFANTVLEASHELGATRVVSMGALLSDVAHSRPIRVIGSSSDPQITIKTGLTPSRYQGPTGIVGVLQAMSQQQGMVSTSLWANIPHYVAQTPSPKGALAIVKKLQLLLDLELDLSDLESATRDYQVQIDKVIASDEDAQAYVAELESRIEDDEEPEIMRISSAEEIAKEAEKFLRGLATDD